MPVYLVVLLDAIKIGAGFPSGVGLEQRDQPREIAAVELPMVMYAKSHNRDYPYIAGLNEQWMLCDCVYTYENLKALASLADTSQSDPMGIKGFLTTCPSVPGQTPN